MDIKDLVLSSLHELELGVEEEAKKNKKIESEKVEKTKNNEKSLKKDNSEKNSNRIEIEEDIKITKNGKIIELKEKIIENDNGELELDSVESIQQNLNDEKEFLLSLRERLLVLFEGLKSSNNKKVEAKVDLILNFFEYLLATIEDKLEKK